MRFYSKATGIKVVNAPLEAQSTEERPKRRANGSSSEIINHISKVRVISIADDAV